ncbi:FG-GAP-like repeat-containing protein [Streptomyces indicus]|uniref:FG-GAP-like repeat-containing protein n=1 Tax=Streptomyces indicus TaxID=417292 RepID=UPI001FE935C2|nr:FG-GAP-like repeat-containing protein [Streptomyces indicus]
MFSRLIRGALTAATTAGLLAGVLAGPAEAASGYDRCPWDKLCLFSQPRGQGEMLIVGGGKLTLGSWDNRTRSFANYTDHPVCFFLAPRLENGLESTHFYSGQESFDESSQPWLDKAVSSLDLGPEADFFCGGESRRPTYEWEGPVKPRPAGLPSSGAFGDLNGDGYADLVSGNKFGQLWATNPPAAGDNARLVGGGWNAMTKLTRHGDYNGDAKEDLYARDKDGVLWFYPGRGDGGFGTRVRVGGGWNTMRDLAAAGDLTGDGRRDLLAADTAGVLWTYPGDGKGIFGSRVRVGGGWSVMNELVGAGDMNADGRSDLVARDSAGRLWMYPGNGKGVFGSRKLIGTGGWNGLTELAGAGDVTGDGRPDLVAHAPGSKTLRVYPGTGAADGGLKSPVTLAQLPATVFVL